MRDIKQIRQKNYAKHLFQKKKSLLILVYPTLPFIFSAFNFFVYHHSDQKESNARNTFV